MIRSENLRFGRGCVPFRGLPAEFRQFDEVRGPGKDWGLLLTKKTMTF